METTIFYIIIGILVFDYALERLLDHLNASRMGQSIPNALAGVYDPDKYDRQQRYQKTNTQFSLISATFSLVVVRAPVSILAFRAGIPRSGKTNHSFQPISVHFSGLDFDWEFNKKYPFYIKKCRASYSDIISESFARYCINLWHPSRILYSFLEYVSFAGAFSQKTVKYFWAHMKDASKLC